MRIKTLAILGILLVTMVSVTFIVAAQTQQPMSLSGTAHWVNSSGIKRYSADANLNVNLSADGTTLNLTGPVNITSKEGTLIASFNLSLNGTKSGNNIVFDLGNATVLTTATDELTVGELLYEPDWDGQWTKNNRVKLDGDIYRPDNSSTPKNEYLDILLTLHGTVE